MACVCFCLEACLRNVFGGRMQTKQNYLSLNSLAYSVSAKIKWKNGLMRMDLVIFSDLLCKELSLCSDANFESMISWSVCFLLCKYFSVFEGCLRFVFSMGCCRLSLSNTNSGSTFLPNNKLLTALIVTKCVTLWHIYVIASIMLFKVWF